jgi:trans-aconitate methyltransferase
VDGLDLNEEFVAIAQQNNPDGRFFIADMTDFSSGRRYDAVVCLFSAIGYVRTVDRVVATLTRFASHLNDRGVILVEPWFTKEEMIDAFVSAGLDVVYDATGISGRGLYIGRHRAVC